MSGIPDLVFIEKGLAAARPAANAVPGKRRGWFATDTLVLSISDGAVWTDIGPGAGGGTVTGVTSSDSSLTVSNPTTTPDLVVATVDGGSA